MTCPRCGQTTRTVVYTKEGTSRCPSCVAAESYDINPATAIFRDEIPGGIICENYGPHPIRFDSHSERRRYMAAHGLREKEKFSPMPGTDKDPQGIPNPKGYVDPYTLAAAADLICRNGRKAAFDGVKSGVLRNLNVEVIADAEEMRKALGQ